MGKIAHLMLAALIALSLSLSPLATPPAQAWIGCGGHDHFHNHRFIKHDRRGLTTFSGHVWRRWDIKHRTAGKDTYHRVDIRYADCGPGGRA